MHLCVWAIFTAPRVLPALASRVQPLGFPTQPTASHLVSEPWGQQPLPQWPHSSRASLQLPTALPCHVPLQPQPVPGRVPGAQSWWPPGLAGAVGQSPVPGSPAVSNTTISTIQKGGSCQQPVRQQKHPGTILAEKNRKDPWSCCKAPTATSMAFIYFWECPYIHTLLCKGYISLQTAPFLLLAGNFLDISEGLVKQGLLKMAIPVAMVHGAWASTSAWNQQMSSQWKTRSKASVWE